MRKGYCESFGELMTTPAGHAYGQASGNEKCQDCMVHCGYEPSAVAATFGSWRGLLKTLQCQLGTLWRASDIESPSPPGPDQDLPDEPRGSFEHKRGRDTACFWR